MIVWSRKLLESLDSIYVTPGALSLYRKQAIVKLGGFDEKNMTEDIEIAWRLLMNGFKIKMAPDAVSLTKVPESLKKWWHQRIRWNIGGIQTMLKYKHCFFKGQFKSLGNFVLPFFSISYVLSLLGLSLLMFVLGKSVYTSSAFSTTASSIGVNPLNHLEIYYLPDIFTYFGLVIFTFSLVWVKISLNITKERPSSSMFKNLLDLLLYLTLYITIFPINLIQSMWKYVRNDQKW